MQELEFSDDNDSTVAGSTSAASLNNKNTVTNCQVFFEREYIDSNNSDSEEDDDDGAYFD